MNEPASGIRLPYPGLRPFDAADAAIFFGREVQVDAMLQRLEDDRFVAVVGSSGSGKSSLVRAGLIPAIREGFLLGVTDWIIPVIRPGFRPFDRLAEALLQERARFSGAGPVTSNRIERGLTVAALRRNSQGLAETLCELGFPDSAHAVLVVDQFEELFAFRRRGPGSDQAGGRDEAAAFVNLLLGAIATQNIHIWVVVTLRSDFIGDCEAFLGLPEAVSRSQFLVPRLDRPQMSEAITGPSRLTTAEYRPFTFEDGLVNRFINEAGDRPDQLPLMQHALMRTWMIERDQKAGQKNADLFLTFEDYEASGGIDRALSDHAEKAWQEIKDQPQLASVARHLFLLLCEASPDGQITRRRPPASEVMRVSGGALADVEAVVRTFQRDERNFVVTSPPEGFSEETRLDISHEALLRQWRRLSGPDGWLALERHASAELRRLVAGAELSNRGEGGLLSARDLARVKEWKDRVHPSLNWAQRYVTPEDWRASERYIEDSAKEQARLKKEEAHSLRRQRNATLLAGAALALIAAAAVWQAVWAKRVSTRAQSALTTSFLRTIGVSTNSESISSGEREALWELAALEDSNDPVRDQFLMTTLANENNLRHGSAHGGVGFRAAAGLSPTRWSLVGRECIRLETNLIERILAETDADKEAVLSDALKTVVALPTGRSTAELAGSLAAAIEGHRDSDAVASLSEALAIAAVRLDSSQAAAVARQLLTTLTNKPRSSFSTQLGAALVVAVRRTEGNDAGMIGEAIVAALERESEADRFTWLENALAAIAPRMDRKAAAALLTRGAGALLSGPADAEWKSLVQSLKGQEAAVFGDRLILAMAQSSNSMILPNLGAAIEDLAPALDPDKRHALLLRAAGMILETIERKRDPALGEVLINLVRRFEGEHAQMFARRLAEGMSASTNAMLLSALGAALGAMDMKQIGPQASALMEIAARQLVTRTVASVSEQSPVRLKGLTNALISVGTNLESGAAADVLKALVSAMPRGNSAPGQKFFRGQIVPTMIPLASRLRGPDAAAFVGALIAEIEKEGLSSEWGLLFLGPNSVAPGLDDEAARALEVFLLAEIKAKSETDNPASIEGNEGNKLLLSLGGVLGSLPVAAGSPDRSPSRGAVADALLLAMKRAPTSAAGEEIGSVLSAVASRMNSRQAAPLADKLVKAMDEVLRPTRQGHLQRANFGTVLSPVVSRMDEQDARAFVNRFIVSMNQDYKGYLLGASGAALARAAPKLGSSDAFDLAEFLVSSLEKDNGELPYLGDALRGVGLRLDAAGAATFAQQLMKMIKKAVDEEAYDWLPNLENALAAAVSKLDRAQASLMLGQGADGLIVAMEHATELESLILLASTLETMAAQLQPNEARALAERLMKAMEAAKDSDIVASLGSQLPGIIPNLNARFAAPLLERGLRRVLSAIETEPVDRMYVRLVSTRLDLILACLGNSLPPSLSKRAVRFCVAELMTVWSPSPASGSRKHDPSSQLRELCRQLDPEDLVEALKNPFCVGEPESILLRELEQRTPVQARFHDDLSTFVAIAPELGLKRLSRADLERKAVRPQASTVVDELRRFESR